MKIILALLLSTLAAAAQSNLAAISDVIAAERAAMVKAAVEIKPTPGEIFTAQQLGLTAKPHLRISQKLLLPALASVDTSKCPDDFKKAWQAYVTAIAAPQKLTPAEFAEALSHGQTGAVAGVVKAATEKQKYAAGVQAAILQVKLCGSSYGFTNWLATATPPQ